MRTSSFEEIFDALQQALPGLDEDVWASLRDVCWHDPQAGCDRFPWQEGRPAWEPWEFLAAMETILEKAINDWLKGVQPEADEQALHALRTIAALGVDALQVHGTSSDVEVVGRMVNSRPEGAIGSWMRRTLGLLSRESNLALMAHDQDDAVLGLILGMSTRTLLAMADYGILSPPRPVGVERRREMHPSHPAASTLS